MHLSTFVAVLLAGLVPFVVPQTVDPNSVDDSTKGKS